MNYTSYDIRKTCEHPGCKQWGIYKVNLTFAADYMAKLACEDHQIWARQQIYKYMPKDR